MDTYQALLFVASVLLVAFAVEQLSSALRAPSVIMMIATGVLSKWILNRHDITLGEIDEVVTLMGTIGLVLIVLEGALDIDAGRDRWPVAWHSTQIAVAGVVACLLVFGTGIMQWLGWPLRDAPLVATPLAVISSAVAIPSSQYLPPRSREFVIYESSISDIVGVLVFFSIIASDGTIASIAAGLFGGGTLSLLLSLLLATAMVFLLTRIGGHVRFIPLLAGLFALYAAGKLLHLSPLILVLVFGLLLNNYSKWMRFPPLRKWADTSFPSTVEEFKVLVRELTFAVRGVFFILLGYWANLEALASWSVWLIAAGVLSTIYLTRFAILVITKQSDARALVWVAPRGLITVLLFFNAKTLVTAPPELEGAILLVVLISSSLTLMARKTSCN